MALPQIKYRHDTKTNALSSLYGDDLKVITPFPERVPKGYGYRTKPK